MASTKRIPGDLVGAHVSTAGGIALAPARADAIGATAIQVFTKTPSQWREPTLDETAVRSFRRALRASNIRYAVSHDSYLINLASPDPVLSERSVTAFTAELSRCRRLGIRQVVSHPGNYIDDRTAGLERNAGNYTRCLRAVPGVLVLIEATAGGGTVLGSTFEELATLRRLIAEDVRSRVAFCADTCHLYSAGLDLVGEYDAVWRHWQNVIGLRLLRCLHLNDSKTPRGSRRDRHELIGEGTLGPLPFRRIMADPRFRRVPKIIETPKGDDPVRSDRRMLRRLRAYAAAAHAPLGSSRRR
ncbi:MAG TPA: deoxyribonuclease IV [Gemmatimonadales bacterium]|nr:deoxyribonuclease IV [Gemmatimonadales bacterium]